MVVLLLGSGGTAPADEVCADGGTNVAASADAEAKGSVVGTIPVGKVAALLAGLASEALLLRGAMASKGESGA